MCRSKAQNTGHVAAERDISQAFVERLTSAPDDCRLALRGFIRVLDDDLSPREGEHLPDLAYEMALDRANDGARCGKVPVGAPPNRSFDDWLRTCMFDARLRQLSEKQADRDTIFRFLIRFLRLHDPQLNGAVRGLPHHDQEDVKGEVVKAVLEGYGRVKLEQGALAGWVQGIVGNVVRGLTRREGRRAKEITESQLGSGAAADSAADARSGFLDGIASGDVNPLKLATRREAYLMALYVVCCHGGYPHQQFGFLISKVLLGTTRENRAVQGSYGLALELYRNTRFHGRDGESLYTTYLDEFEEAAGLCHDSQFRGHHEVALRLLRDKLDDSTSVQDVLRGRPQIAAEQEARFKCVLGDLVRETCFADYLKCYKNCRPRQDRGVYEAGIVGDWCNSVRRNVSQHLENRPAGVGGAE